MKKGFPKRFLERTLESHDTFAKERVGEWQRSPEAWMALPRLRGSGPSSWKF